MRIKQFTKIPKKIMVAVFLILGFLLVVCCFGILPVYAEGINAELPLLEETQPPALPDGELPKEIPQRDDVRSEKQWLTNAEPIANNLQNKIAIQEKQQHNGIVDDIDLLFSFVLLLLAFLFVKFYKRKNY